MGRQASCADRVAKEWKDRASDLRKLWDAYSNGNEDGVPDLGTIYEYGLGFDYVAPGTFQGQRRGYWRWQFSWGGPSDELRFFCDEGMRLTRAEYWFLDWFDGAKRVLRGKDLELAETLFDWFDGAGSVENAYREATE